MKTYDLNTGLAIMSMMTDVNTLKALIAYWSKVKASNFCSGNWGCVYPVINLENTNFETILYYKNKNQFIESLKGAIRIIENEILITKNNAAPVAVELPEEEAPMTDDEKALEAMFFGAA